MDSKCADSVSIWHPLREPLFRSLWIASVASSMGNWMHEAGASYLLASLTPSPILIALIQTAISLPVFFLALPAGALADVLDRRKMLLVTQTWMGLIALSLGILTFFGGITAESLLLFTLMLNIGAAMNAPAWQATIPEILSPAEIGPAVSLNGVSLNVARAVGPAVGGIVIAAAGPAAVFLLNAVSFLSVIAVIYRWRRPSSESKIPHEHVFEALRTGVRYVGHSPRFFPVLVRVFAFIVFGSALWALFPLVARREMGLNAFFYGILFGSLGCGSVAGALLFSKLQGKQSLDRILSSATLLFAAACFGLAQIRQFAPLCVALFFGGIAWVHLMSGFIVAAQSAVPGWVRARATAVYILCFHAGMAGGSLLWGYVANDTNPAIALYIAAGGMILGLLAALKYPLSVGDGLDLVPSMAWPELQFLVDPVLEVGPVLITVEYCIDPSRVREFGMKMYEVRLQRHRDGAYRWGLFNDPEDPRRYVETFLVESWAEHLRQRERGTVYDRFLEDAVRAFHVGATPPRISHLVYAAIAESKASITLA